MVTVEDDRTPGSQAHFVIAGDVLCSDTIPLHVEPSSCHGCPNRIVIVQKPDPRGSFLPMSPVVALAQSKDLTARRLKIFLLA